MIRSAKDLSAEQKAVIETLLGRRVLESEAISVRTIEPPVLSAERKHELSEALKMYFVELDARRPPTSPEEAEEILNEAIKSVRPGYSQHR
jgi:hypothetical protein